VRAKISGRRSELAQFAQEFPSVLHVGIIGLVRTKEAPDWTERSFRVGGVHANDHGVGNCRRGKVFTAENGSEQ
jgi:hypothetical protein